MLREGLATAWLPLAEALSAEVWAAAEAHAALAMPSHTHGQPASPTTLGKELAVFAARWDSPDSPDPRRAAPRQVQRGRRYLRRPRDRLPRGGLGGALPPFRRGVRDGGTPTTQIESHDALAEVFHAGGPLRRGAHRLLLGHVGVHQPGLPAPAARGRRGRLVDHAPQGQSHRLRECRGERRDLLRAARPSGLGPADLSDATGPVGLSALRNMGVALANSGLTIAAARVASPRSTRTPRSWPPSSAPTGRCWPRPSRP